MTVADKSGAARPSVWEKEVGTLKQGQSYHLEKVSVREYVGGKFLSTSIKVSIITAIPDVGRIDDETQVETSADVSPGDHLANAKIIGI